MLEESETFTPAAAAGAVSVTVPVEELPPVTVEGLSVTLPTVPCVDGGTALMVRSAVMVLAEVAETVTGVEPATADVVTVKVAVL